MVAGKLGPSGSRDRRPTGGCRQALDANYLAAHSWLVFPLMRLMVRTGVQEDGEEAVGEVAIGQRASLDRILVGVAAGPVARGLASDRVRVGSCLMGPDTEAHWSRQNAPLPAQTGAKPGTPCQRKLPWATRPHGLGVQRQGRDSTRGNFQWLHKCHLLMAIDGSEI